ncbi:hypothetical protein JW872_01365 [Candidatus Babeliales bacterium]|nr:hypothetical protein [Candidatus Babeliales bacterium]
MKKIITLCVLLSSTHWNVNAVNIAQLKKTIECGGDVTLIRQLQLFGLHRLTPRLIDTLCDHAQQHENTTAIVLLKSHLPKESTAPKQTIHHDTIQSLFLLIIVVLAQPPTSSTSSPLDQIVNQLHLLQRQHWYAQLLWYCCLGRLLQITAESLKQQQQTIQELENLTIKRQYEQAKTLSQQLLYFGTITA